MVGSGYRTTGSTGSELDPIPTSDPEKIGSWAGSGFFGSDVEPTKQKYS